MKRFTKEEDDFLRKNLNAIPAKRMGKMMGRSEGTARQRMQVLGIAPTEEAKKRFRSESQFKRGSTPYNKGKKMSPEMIAKYSHTFFKKGNLPPNTKYDGHERITKEGYVEIRVRLGKYVLKHRLIWEQAHGKIPRGHIIVFKDGNAKNITIDNLEMITMKENLQRNSINRYPKELKHIIRLTHKLKRKIDEKQN